MWQNNNKNRVAYLTHPIVFYIPIALRMIRILNTSIQNNTSQNSFQNNTVLYINPCMWKLCLVQPRSLNFLQSSMSGIWLNVSRIISLVCKTRISLTLHKHLVIHDTTRYVLDTMERHCEEHTVRNRWWVFLITLSI